ncbi:MAG: EexN family lipoprotein [Gammaproteobacteria bacterium]|nr:EexN family lipoprotein [Gammaproteobacteria bacterium]MDH3409171.1 EexN family lipoprotein [Gammaproteobacteria bacterium]MDH3552325.1 EexN family lipoprotein [Gammaproteobacteria bacterium]
MKNRVSLLLCGFVIAAGCAKEPPPRSVNEFMDDPIMLEAVVVRCAQNRVESRYDAECVNARQAVSIIEAKQERERRDAFEAQSDRKRQALRRTQQAAAEARRRAAEAERVRKEAEYLAQFGELPPTPDDATDVVDPAANAPSAVMPDPVEAADEARAPTQSVPTPDGGNAPVAESQPPSSNLDAIREELRKRTTESGN